MADQPENEVQNPEAAPNDTMASNRSIPVVSAKEVPLLPRGYKATSVETRRKLLRSVGEEEEEEVKAALRTLVKRSAMLAQDLGKNAPDAEQLGPLLERLENAQETITATQLFLAYLNEVEDIALSDAIMILEKVNRLYLANVDDEPQLKTHYASVSRVFEGRANAIKEGLSRRRAEDAKK